ncbi:MAG TPA: hypothetical protein VMG08_17370 [Allosphingosinicella sp.]|nr:hypothetical protein [Allosphingosinicella sp.]
MRLLFIENREKTYFWAAIARRLAAMGHDVAWLVQNPPFARDLPGRVYVIPFPGRRELDHRLDLADFPALATDRGRQHFEAGSAHYAYYSERIGAILDTEKPGLVIGESTLFHELLAIDLCEKRHIPFTYPGSERYPPGRFSMYGGATQKPLIESGEALDWDKAVDLATRVRDRHVIPEYMTRGARQSTVLPRLRRILSRGRVIFGRWRGEHYNTPSIRRKYALTRMAKRNLERWRAIAGVPADPARTILYPLQQQPENTIDVWGRPDCDQVDILRRILAAAPADVAVAVKGNPRPYYEVSDALLDLAEAEPRLHMLPLDWSMEQALAGTTGAVTVTGTVGYEAVCGRGRCLSVAHPVLNADFPDFTAPSIEAAVLRLLDDPEAGRGSPELGARLMQRLYRRSFPGLINDPISDPLAMAPANIEAVARGIDSALARLEAGEV